MYTDSRTVAAYSKFFFRSTTEASPLSNCFTKDRNLENKKTEIWLVQREIGLRVSVQNWIQHET